jgi:hypothetical protein
MTDANEMSLARLRDMLAAYGAAPSRWPADERDAAEALIARSEPARAALAEAAHVDLLLDAAEPPPPSDRLAWRLRAIGPKPQAEASRPPRASWLAGLRPMTAVAQAAVIAVAIIGGVGIGLSIPPRGAGDRSGTVEALASNEELDLADDFAAAAPETVAFEAEDEDGSIVTAELLDDDGIDDLPLH